jgi:hypothetical protein
MALTARAAAASQAERPAAPKRLWVAASTDPAASAEASAMARPASSGVDVASASAIRSIGEASGELGAEALP